MGEFWALPWLTRAMFAFMIRRATAAERVGKEQCWSHLQICCSLQSRLSTEWELLVSEPWCQFSNRPRCAIVWRGQVCVSMWLATCSVLAVGGGTLVRTRQGSWSSGSYRLAREPKGCSTRQGEVQAKILPKDKERRAKYYTKSIVLDQKDSVDLHVSLYCVYPSGRGDPNHTWKMLALNLWHIKMMTVLWTPH